MTDAVLRLRVSDTVLYLAHDNCMFRKESLESINDKMTIARRVGRVRIRVRVRVRVIGGFEVRESKGLETVDIVDC